MTVLILSTSDNLHSSAVEAAVKRRGAEVARLDFDLIGDRQRHNTIALNKDGALILDGHAMRSEDVSGVFLHHALDPGSNAQIIDQLDRSLITSGWRNCLDWVETITSKAIWVNKPSACRNSACPGVQLNVARQCGLRVPKTLFTNNIDQLKSFAEDCGQIIVKSGPLHGVNMIGHKLRTNVINPKIIATESLVMSPCLFQEYIEKDFEARVHVIGTDVLACRIDSQVCKETRVDWRNYCIAKTPHSALTLSLEIIQACRAVTKELGLLMGIIDLIVTPKGETVFLEANSQGYWNWIEQLIGLPITETLASLLVKEL